MLSASIQRALQALNESDGGLEIVCVDDRGSVVQYGVHERDDCVY